MIEFFLKYPEKVFAQGEIIFAREWPVWIGIALFLTAALIITGILLYRRKAMDSLQLGIILFLQLGMVALVLLVIWQPSILTIQLREDDNVIALMLDTSRSMGYGEGDNSRMQQAKSVLQDSAIEQVKETYNVQRFLFAEKASQVDSFEALPGPVEETRLGESLQQVLGMSRGTPLSAVIVISDGADNSGGLTQDQLAEVAGYNVPVHTIGVGRDRISEDLELQSVSLPEKALPGTLLSARVAIRHDNPGLARLKVYDDERLLTTRDIELRSGMDVTTSFVDVPVSEAGYRALRFALDPWPGEQVLENNSRTTVVDVREEEYRVLYVEGEPRWEYKFMRRAMDKDPGVGLVSLLRVSQNKYYRQGINNPDELAGGFPAEKRELFRYHALIIGSIEAATFSEKQQMMIRGFVSERGGSLLMIAGPNGLANGGWQNSLVDEVLPAKLASGEAGFVREKVRVVLTQSGKYSPVLKLSEDAGKNAGLWGELPEIADYQHIGELRPAAISLLNIMVNGNEQPLLVTQPYGRGNSYILATGGTWRWQMSLPVEDQRHETFWRQLLRELVIDSPVRFSLSTEVVADRVKVNAELRDENYEPERNLELTAIVTPESGEAMTLDMIPSAEFPGLSTAEFDAERSGLYSIEVISRRDDEPVDSTRVAVYHDAGKAESFSLRRNQSILDQVAEVTGGRSWDPQELDELADAVRLSGAGIMEREIRPLWDAPLLFLILLLLKSMEWLLRRRWKTI